MKKSNLAVLTCDLIESRSFSAADRSYIVEKLKQKLAKWGPANGGEYIIYRGDSIQAVVENSDGALRHGLYLKSLVKSLRLSNSQRKSVVDIRISIGIGELDYKGDTLLDSDGSAFQHSGRRLDQMKQSDEGLTLTTSDEEINEEWSVILTLLESVIDGWSLSSAEIVNVILEDSELPIEKVLGISQPAVSLRKKHANWNAIEKTLAYFESQFKDQ